MQVAGSGNSRTVSGSGSCVSIKDRLLPGPLQHRVAGSAFIGPIAGTAMASLACYSLPVASASASAAATTVLSCCWPCNCVLVPARPHGCLDIGTL